MQSGEAMTEQKTREKGGSEPVFLRTGIGSYGHYWIFRWAPLLYTAFWFTDSFEDHTHFKLIYLLLFYAAFLLTYVRFTSPDGGQQRRWLGAMFVLGYLYFPFNNAVAGEFVYPVVMSVFVLQHPKASKAFQAFLLIALAQAVGVLLETQLCHGRMHIAENVIFYMVAIGLSNFAYARHVLASNQLAQANGEIEHLAQVAERERIARDLHDLLGHTLTVIVLKSDMANRLFTIDPELAHREIAEVEATARKALAEVRDAVAGYRAEGLQAEVLQARRALASVGVQLTTNLEPIALPAAEANVLCMVLREATTNVIRHAAATACRLEVDGDRSCVRLTIEDNGSGDMAAEGNGLRGMRERVAGTGGTMVRERSSLGGTKISVELPLKRATAFLADMDIVEELKAAPAASGVRA